MKTINLTQGQVALVDDEDYDFLMQWKWQAHKDKSTYYATRVEYGKNIKKGIKMHRVIMNTPRNMETDHKDRNGLNNQKYNLRICTRGQNQTNKRNWGKSKYKGVNLAPCIRPSGKICPRITAQINIKGKVTHLGCFKTEEEAARKYDEIAKELYGEFANLNFKD